MSRKWTAACTMMLGIAILLSAQVFPARAQEPPPENDANCVSCHEHEYYLYDSGKWFCLCEAPMHCVYCHGGRTDSLEEKTAHEGLVLYPTRAHAERCQACHSEDYMERVVTFSTIAGVSTNPQPIITATPAGPIAAALELLPIAPSVPLLRLGQLESWRLLGLGLVGIAMIGVIVFGYNCWRFDCHINKQSQ